jgi:tripartite-type tricarboxylate transporter receptor subunit TctC
MKGMSCRTHSELPLPGGERVGVRGARIIEGARAPHPTRGVYRRARLRRDPMARRPRIKSGAGYLPNGERWKRALGTAFALSLALCSVALAQTTPDARWPDKPIRMIVPLPAGSAVDLVGRLIGQKLGDRLGQPIIVENRVGASGAIGTEAVARSPADGYTLGMATSTTLATGPVLNPNLRYDPINDIAPVSLVGISPYVLVAHPSVPARNVAELIALAKAKPRTLSYSSVGEASLAHLAGLLFSSMTGVELNHIPYKSSTQAVIDLNEGRIDLQFGILPTSLQFIRAGKLRALAVTTDKRLEELPDVPTLAESGLAGFEATLWLAVIAPKGVSAAAIARLNRDIAAILEEPDVRNAWVIQGIYPQGSTPDALRERTAREIEKWRTLMARIGPQPQ